MFDSINFGPDCFSVITTYRCTAECQECCFECTTDDEHKLNIEDIKSAINDAVSIGTIKYVVWTGGECTLLGETLVDGIAYANSMGLPSRIVSNGWWAKSEYSANRLLQKLINAGLRELNISTGDNHQEFVSAETAIRAAIVGAKLGLTSVISVERTKNSLFTVEDILQNKEYIEFVNENKNIDKFKIVNPVWVSFHEDTNYEYEDYVLNNPDLNKGCNNLFTFIGVDPQGDYIGCCGLTMRYIPSMHLGNIKKSNAKEVYFRQYDDFLKRWIFVRGPLAIIRQLKVWDETIEIPKFPHNCMYCAYLYNNSKIREVISKNYYKIIEEIDAEFSEKIKWFQTKSENGFLQID